MTRLLTECGIICALSPRSSRNEGEAALEPTSATFHIPALDCPEELFLVRKALERLPGVGELNPDYLQRRLRVEYDPSQVKAEQIAARIAEIGFSAEPVAAGSLRLVAEVAPVRYGTLAGGVLLVLALAARWLTGATTTSVALLAVAATVVAGWSVARAGWRAVRLRALDMNALMTIAAAGAIATGEYFEAATAMFLFGVSLWLEGYSLGRTRRAIRGLVELTPDVAHRIEAGGVRDVEANQLRLGDRVLVKPGERMPVDGVVEAGSSSVNQAPITGESLPCEKSAGDHVYAGTVNGEGSLEVRTTRAADETTLAHIARLVEQAQSRRSPSERFVDRFARRYTPAVIALAVIVAAAPPLLAALGVDWAAAHPPIEWLHRGLVLLVIACPCALVISTPVTILCGLQNAARRGVLVKGGEFLETAGRIEAVVFDKTGTLTTGEVEVVGLLPAAGRSVDELLRIAAALESHSEHPLAAAIVAEANRRGLTWTEPRQFAALRGFGVQGELEGQTCYAGSLRLLVEQGLAGETEARQLIASSNADTQPTSTALVATRDRLLGAILLADRPRADAASAIAALKQFGLRPIVMLTGDAASVARHVADELGIDDVRADLLPQEKVDAVRQLVEQHPRLAMVGDGVNDAPALAAAPLGIALGSQASDAALETADVVVMSPHVERVAELVRLGRRCRRVLAQNIALALSLKAAVLAAAVAGPESLARLWLAVAADVGASLVVIANGMRLLQRRRE